MLELLHHLFAAVCGQNTDHTWAPGGLMLPCCQRCIGLYVGALAAMALHLKLRPRISGRFLQVHGLFLLQMLPFGFHWLPQGPVLRTVTGLLFGFGVVACLWLVPASRLQTDVLGNPRKTRRYGFGLAASLVLAPVAARGGARVGAYVLSWLVFGGALALAGLVMANVGHGFVSLARLWRGAQPRAAA